VARGAYLKSISCATMPQPGLKSILVGHRGFRRCQLFVTYLPFNQSGSATSTFMVFVKLFKTKSEKPEKAKAPKVLGSGISPFT